MRILLLTTHLNLGGIGIYVLLLAKALAQRGHAVLVVSSGGNLVDSLLSFGVQHLIVDIKTKSEFSPRVFFAARRLERIIKENNIQIIHAHTRVAQVLAHLAAGKAKIPYVTTCHGFFKPRLFRKVFPCWGRHCIAISDAVRGHLVNDFAVKKEDVTVVYNGIEVERFYPDKFNQEQKEQTRKKYGVSADAAVIGTVARFSSVKGQQYLIQAMAEITKVVPKVQLLLVGEGPEKNQLAALAKELGLEKNVFFSPATLDTSLPLSIMDIFVFPSLMEGLGLAIIEAQAMGLAVVASDVGGIYTLVKDGVNGLLVRPKNPLVLSEAILVLLRDKKLAQQFGQRAREQVIQYFSLKQMVDGIERIYQKISS